MNNPLAHSNVPPADPVYARRERRETRRFWGALTIAIVAIAGAAWAVVGTEQNHKEITEVKTRVEHSACQVDAAGQECQRTKQESSQAASVYTTCIAFKKVGYICPKPGSQAAKREVQSTSESVRSSEQGSGQKGVMPSTPESGHSQPGPTTGPTEQPASTPSPPESSAPEATHPIRETVEAVTGPVKEAVCSLPIHLCP